MFCPAVKKSSRLCIWKMKPICRRTSGKSEATHVCSCRPSTTSLPVCTVRRPPMSVRSVVLPHPDGPVKSAISPGQISRSMSKSTCLGRHPSSYEKLSPRVEMAGLVGPKTSPSGPPGRAALDSANKNAIGFSCRSEYVRWVGLLELSHCHQSGEAAHYDGESEDQDGAAKGHVHR